LLFQKLASDIEAMIARGSFRPGDRLPSVRTLEVERGLARGTVCQALAELEARGLVEARPRAGYFVRPRRVLTAPKTDPVPSRARRVPLPHLTDAFVAASAEPSLVPLGGTVLAPAILPLRQLTRLGREVLAGDGSVFTSYGPPAGDSELRRQVGRRLVTLGVRAAQEDIIVTSGAMNAMRLAVAIATKPGDTVAVESPTFFAVLPMLRDAGLLVVEVATHPATGVDLESLAEIASQRPLAAAIVTPSFHNPTGASMSTQSKRTLLDLARRHRFHLIEDDVYGDLYFGARRPRPLASLASPTDDVFYCSSFSKTLAAGLRVGFLVNRTHRAALARAKLSSTISSPIFNQRVLAGFLASGAYDRHLRKLRDALRRQVAAATQSIARNFPSGVEVTAPGGGFFLWVRLPGRRSGLAVYERAVEEGVAILPGHVCAIDDRYADYIRLSCGHPWSEALERGMCRLGEIIRAQ
jgi:DNA-binding transcriptional MocR family regulator